MTAPRQPEHPSTPVALSRAQRHELANKLYLVTSFAEQVRSGRAGPVTSQQEEFLGHVLECAEGIRRLLLGDEPGVDR